VSSDGTGGGKRRQLGRGLSSLLGDDGDDVAQMDRGRQTRLVAIENIEPGAAQPRRDFDETELRALAESIRDRGVLQPILLRRRAEDDGALEIIAGERRWRAAQMAGLHEIPAMVRDFTDTEALEIALIENIQRSDLTALEEANGFQRLIEEYGHTQEDVAQAIGKSRSHVANTLRLLSLPPKAREHLEAGRLTAGHARALLVSDDADRLADYVVAGGLSVRATERLVRGRTGPGSSGSRPASGSRSKPAAEKDADTRALEQSITESLGLTVDITPRDPDRGTLTIHYQSLDQLDDLLAKLTVAGPSETASLVVADAMFSDDEPGFSDSDSGFSDDESGDYTEVDGDIEAVDLEFDGGMDDPAPDTDHDEDDGGEPDEDPDQQTAAVDFNALMAQTASLLASGAAADDLDGASVTTRFLAMAGPSPEIPARTRQVRWSVDCLARLMLSIHPQKPRSRRKPMGWTNGRARFSRISAPIGQNRRTRTSRWTRRKRWTSWNPPPRRVTRTPTRK
jgi:ParB family transcriptional regulator, chromosome partitioning protein